MPWPGYSNIIYKTHMPHLTFDRVIWSASSCGHAEMKRCWTVSQLLLIFQGLPDDNSSWWRYKEVLHRLHRLSNFFNNTRSSLTLHLTLSCFLFLHHGQCQGSPLRRHMLLLVPVARAHSGLLSGRALIGLSTKSPARERPGERFRAIIWIQFLNRLHIQVLTSLGHVMWWT